MFCALLGKISGERLQDHWSSCQVFAVRNSCSLGCPYVLFCILTICDISFFPILVLGLDLGSDCLSS